MKRISGSQYQCSQCFEHFAGPHSLARHYQTGHTAADLACLPPDAMLALGMRETRYGFWTIDTPRPPSSASKHPTPLSDACAAQAIDPTPCPDSGFDDRRLEAAP
jgi:hypothetical protein